MVCKKCGQEPDNGKLNDDGICWGCYKEVQVEGEIKENPKKQITLGYEDVFEDEATSEMEVDLEDVKQEMLNNVKQIMLNNKDRYLGLRITSDLREKLWSFADHEGVTLSEISRRILQLGADAFNDTQQKGEPKTDAL